MALDNSYLKVSDGNGDAAKMTVTNDKLLGATTLKVDTLVNVPAKFIGTVGTVLPSGFINPSTKLDFFGQISGSDIEIDGWCPGSSDRKIDSGEIVVIKPNTAWADMVASFVQTALQTIYPVGSSYFNKTDSTNPAILFGFGTWVAEEGVVLGGISTDSGSAFNVSAGTEIGEEKHSLTSNENGAHTHGGVAKISGTNGAPGGTTSLSSVSGSTSSSGLGTPHNNVQPTLVGYLWTRTA